MNKKQIFYFNIVLLNLVFLNNALAETCKSYSEKMTGQSGTMTLVGDLCLDNDTYSGPTHGTMTVSYANYNVNGAFSRDGIVVLSYATNRVDPAPSFASETYHGGPVSYVIGQQTYVVEFQNLTYKFNGSMVQIGESGSILLNGAQLEAKDVPYEYVKIF